MRKRGTPNVRLVIIWSEVRDLRNLVRKRREVGESICTRHLVLALKGEVRHERDHIRVPRPLPVSVDGGLNVAHARIYRGKGVRNGELGIVMRVDPPDHVTGTLICCQLRARIAHDLTHAVSQGSAVCVAEHQRRCTRVARRAQGIQRIGGIGLIPVKEVFRVVHQLASALSNIANALGDHGEVLCARRLDHLIHVQRPALPEDGDDRRLCIQERVQVRVALWSVRLVARATEGGELGSLPANLLRRREELDVLRI